MDNLNNSSCYKCSIGNCKTCVGDIDKNTCLTCIDSCNPKYDNNTIIFCDLKELNKLNETNNICSDLLNEINQKNDNEIPISKTKKKLNEKSINNFKGFIKVNNIIEICLSFFSQDGNKNQKFYFENYGICFGNKINNFLKN